MFTELKLAASDPEAVSNFGRSVAVSGNHLIIGRGAPYELSLGAAYIFARNGSTWTQQAKLTNSDAAVFDGYGSAVSIDGDWAVVGASGAGSQGKVYVYHRNGSTWTEEAQLVPSAPGSDLFGTSVSITGNTLVVGTWTSAYVFRRSAAGWTAEATLSDGATTQTLFGMAVCIDGDSIIVGAPHTVIDRQLSAGAAYVFVRNGTSWIQQAMLRPSDATTYAYFGRSVSIRGKYAIVGAPDANSGGATEAGAAYIFERDGPMWTQTFRLEPTQPHKVKQFGWAVSITTTVAGAYAVVGDHADPDLYAISGAAYLYKRVGSSWSLVEPKIKADDAKLFAEFGRAVHIFGDSILIGAPSHTDSEYAQGVAYLYNDFQSLDVGIDADKWAVYAVILFGLIGGGGGVIVLPGGGGGPVDPEPFRQWMKMSAAKRDVYLALMINDLAGLIDDAEGKQEVKKIATGLRRKAAQKLPEVKAQGQRNHAEKRAPSRKKKTATRKHTLRTGRSRSRV